MSNQFTKADVKIADLIIDRLATNPSRLLMDQINAIITDEVQRDRILKILEAYQIIEAHQFWLKAGVRFMEFKEMGAESIFKDLKQQAQMQKWQYSNMKWTNVRSWVALAVSIFMLIWEIWGDCIKELFGK